MPVHRQYFCDTCGQWFLPNEFESHINTNNGHVISEKIRYVAAGEEIIPIDENTTNPPAARYAASANPTHTIVSATATSTTNSSNYNVLNSMTYTPEPGEWLVLFTCSCKGTTKNAEMSMAVFNDGTIINSTERSMGRDSGNQNRDTLREFTLHAVVTTTGSESIHIGFKTTGGTFRVENRSMILIRIGS